jgi:hypothetical protein
VNISLRHRRSATPARRSAGALVATIGSLAATVSIIVAFAGGASDDRPSPQQLPTAGTLTAQEEAAVVEALSQGDSRQRRIAIQVAAGEAGASALADPGILHHHRVDTSATSARPLREVAAERFHHR